MREPNIEELPATRRLLAPVPLEKIEEVATRLLDVPQIECPLRHLFAPGVYVREILMPKGTFVIGAEHKTKHFNMILSGEADVLIGDAVHHLKAPCILVSEPGVRKVLVIKEDMLWATVHANP